jgi:hypothetical protein
VIETPGVIDTAALRLGLVVLSGWLECQEREALRYLIEESTPSPPIAGPTPAADG